MLLSARCTQCSKKEETTLYSAAPSPSSAQPRLMPLRCCFFEKDGTLNSLKLRGHCDNCTWWVNNYKACWTFSGFTEWTLHLAEASRRVLGAAGFLDRCFYAVLSTRLCNSSANHRSDTYRPFLSKAALQRCHRHVALCNVYCVSRRESERQCLPQSMYFLQTKLTQALTCALTKLQNKGWV